MTEDNPGVIFHFCPYIMVIMLRNPFRLFRIINRNQIKAIHEWIIPYAGIIHPKIIDDSNDIYHDYPY
jgi:hypothetical protein